VIRAAILIALVATAALADERRSGSAYMGDALRAMEQDDAANPAMLWVAEGEALWSTKAGAANKACADCHGAVPGAAARYPAFAADAGQVVNLEQRVDLCRQRYQQAPPFGYESRKLLALTAWLARAARATPIAPGDDPPVAAAAATGRALYFQRQGQLNLSCANCHDDHAGGRLGGALIPEAHPTGYPIYRLEWQDYDMGHEVCWEEIRDVARWLGREIGRASCRERVFLRV